MDTNGKNIFAKRLISLRKSKNLSQYTLAEKLGFSRGLIGNYEQGRREPDYNTLKIIADFFNVSCDYLLGRDSVITQNNHIELNERDRKDITKDVDAIMTKIKSNEDGPTYFQGDPMDDEDAELFRQALEVALEHIKIKNKKKYTPKKYRK